LKAQTSLSLAQQRRSSLPRTTLSSWVELVPRMKLMRELHLYQSKLALPLQSTTRKSSRSALADLLVVLLSLRSVAPQRLKSVSSRTESRMLFALLVLLPMRVLSQAVVQLSYMLAESSTLSRVRTSIRMLVSRLSDRPAESHARLFARMLVSRAPLLSTSFLTRVATLMDSTLPRVSM
jgi:hypothetical protein